MLKSLEIKNFRLLQDLKVSKLGNINLIVGKNNAGKSTVLEALQLFASNASPLVLQDIAIFHNEKIEIEENKLDDFFPFEDLFTGRRFPIEDEKIIIGEINTADQLKIQHIFLVKTEETVTDESGETITRTRKKTITQAEIETLSEQPDIEHALRVNKGQKFFDILFKDMSFKKHSFYSHRRRLEQQFTFGNNLPCSMVPARFLSMDELANEWDKIVFQKPANIVMEAMRIIEPRFENLTFVEQRNASSRRVAKIKLSDVEHPVSLNSLGDGILKVFQLLLKLFPAKGGFLLIDEFENGLHYSVQEKIWRLIFELSKELNIQIFATTHSWDCIESFSKVAMENKDIEGVLFRVGKSARKSNYGQIIATVFEQEQLYQITQSDVEVR